MIVMSNNDFNLHFIVVITVHTYIQNPLSKETLKCKAAWSVEKSSGEPNESRNGFG